MSFMDALKNIAGAFAQEAMRNADRMERKCGHRMNDEQRAKLERARRGASALDSWSRTRKDS